MEENALPLPGTENDEQTEAGKAEDADDIPDIAVYDGNKIMLNTNGNIAYDQYGRPRVIVGNRAVLADEEITISLQDDAGKSDEIRIAPETGFIP